MQVITVVGSESEPTEPACVGDPESVALNLLPKEWASGPRRRARAGVGETVVFKTKPQLAVDILTDLDTAGVLPPWVTGDEVYGRDTTLRAFCEDRGVGYVLGVPARSPCS